MILMKVYLVLSNLELLVNFKDIFKYFNVVNFRVNQDWLEKMRQKK